MQIEYWVKKVYIYIIFIAVGLMALHNLIILISEIRRRKKKKDNKIQIQRFSRNEVIQHAVMVLSFFGLAITGFALKYPNAWYFDWLPWLRMSENLRQTIHRICAILMMAVSFYHILYIIFGTRRGRFALKQLLPKWKDFKDVKKNLGYYLNRKKEKPEFGQFDYTEKVEYWALIWGVFVMSLTGLILWFPIFFQGNYAPGWTIKVSEIIHYYEAILATLAIIIWHFFFVIFSPDEYPLNFAMTDGKMDVDHYRKHHRKIFNHLILDWFMVKKGKRDSINDLTQSLVDSIQSKGKPEDEFFHQEIANDSDLKHWINSKLGI